MTRQLTQGQWSGRVAEWNGKPKSAKQAIAAECTRSGHVWAWVPTQDAHVCTRCLALRMPGR